MRTHLSCPSCLLLFSIASFFVGCSAESGPLEHTVSGTVNLDGQPLADGSILFVDPQGKIKSYYANIQGGAYRTEVQAGKWQVQISAYRKSKTEMIPNADGTGEEPATEQYLPARYNEETTLEANVTAGGANTFNFDLNSE